MSIHNIPFSIFKKRKSPKIIPNLNGMGFFPKDSRTSFKQPWPGHVGQSVEHLTRKSEVLASILGLATYFRFSFR